QLIAGSVFVEQRWLEGLDIHFVEVEELWIALVLADVEGGLLLVPSLEVGFHFVARSEVALVAVFDDVEMIVFVPAFVIAVKEAAVGKIGDGKRALLGGLGKLLRLSSCCWNGKNVVDAGLVGVIEDLFVVGREVGATHANGFHELLNGVLLGGVSSGLGLGCGVLGRQ